MLHTQGPRRLGAVVALTLLFVHAHTSRAQRNVEGGGCDLQRVGLFPAVQVDQLVALDDRFVFVARDVHEFRLFVSDGTEDGTEALRDLRTDGSGRPRDLTRAGDRVFFVADDGHSGAELWSTDGTVGGTRRVLDIRVGPQGSNPSDLLGVGDRLHFVANDGFHGREPWVSDGTEEGTTLLVDIEIGSGGSNPGRKVFENDLVWFVAEDSFNGRAIWETNGTRFGTRRVTLDFANGPENPSNLGVANGRIFFSASDLPHGRELWVTDGTSDGTGLVRDIASGERSSDPGRMVTVDGIVWFAANDGATGRELWRSDGTARGTYLVSDVRPGSPGSDPGDVFGDGDQVFFVADDGVSGRELWRTDGTLRGTRILRDLNGGRGHAFNGPYVGGTPLGDRFVFFADDGRLGREVWITDGTFDGTVLLEDLNPFGALRGTVGDERRQGIVPFGDGVVFAGESDLGPAVWWLRCPSPGSRR